MGLMDSLLGAAASAMSGSNGGGQQNTAMALECSRFHKRVAAAPLNNRRRRRS